MHILIVEDNPTISENISLYLRAKGHQASIAKNGAIAFDMMAHTTYDFLIVDRMMPEIDGLSLIRMLQARKIYISFLFLTALSKQIDKIEGLEMGADDYLVKPFDLEELLLRITNICKRRGIENSITDTKILIGECSIDRESQLVTLGGQRVELSPKEYHLLDMLITHRGRVQDRESLYEEVWGDYDVSYEKLDTINVHIAHLRKKLGPELIRTVKGSGYVIDKI